MYERGAIKCCHDRHLRMQKRSLGQDGLDGFGGARAAWE
jgi:hypothetical protein